MPRVAVKQYVLNLWRALTQARGQHGYYLVTLHVAGVAMASTCVPNAGPRLPFGIKINEKFSTAITVFSSPFINCGKKKMLLLQRDNEGSVDKERHCAASAAY